MAGNSIKMNELPIKSVSETDELVGIDKMGCSVRLPNEINRTNAHIGDLSTLKTEDKQDVIHAINSVNDALTTTNNNVGDLESLQTTAKKNLVVALNEVKNTAFPDAPADGKRYVRKDKQWNELTDANDLDLRKKLEYDEDNVDVYEISNSKNTVACSMKAGVKQHVKVSSDQTFGNMSIICNYEDGSWGTMTNTRYTTTAVEFDFTPNKNVVSIGTNYAYQPSSPTWTVRYEVNNPEVVRIKNIEKKLVSVEPAIVKLDELVTRMKVTPDSYIEDSYFDESQHQIVSSTFTKGYKIAVYNIGGGARISYKATSAAGNYNYVTAVDALGNEVQHVGGNYANDAEGEITLVNEASQVYIQVGKTGKDENDYGMFQAFVDTLSITNHATEESMYVHENKGWVEDSALNEDGYIFMPTEIPAFLVIGQSNADGRIANASFPSSITYQGETIVMNKQIPTCLFRYGTLGGYTETYYTGQTEWQFASRNNANLWAFDDILYNLIANKYGVKQFYVVKTTMGATGLQNPKKNATMGMYSWNINFADFKQKVNGKDGSMAMVTKLNCKRAYELVPKLAFKAIFMHQGENDCRRLTGRAKGTYFEDLADLIDFCRSAVRNQDCPFIFGSVPPNSRDYDEMIYHDQQMIAEKLHKCHLVTMENASGWVNDGMSVHFLAPDAVKLAVGMMDVLTDNNYL